MTVAEMSRTYTPEDLLRMPDNGSMELVNGHIVEKQRHCRPSSGSRQSCEPWRN
jgi:hypothetical protein